MATSLKNEAGYEDVIQFNWVNTSGCPRANQAVNAGHDLARMVEADANDLVLLEGDVIDLHLIGHSRGSVVISVALQDLASTEFLPLKSGFVRMTMLDPHPGHNLHSLAIHGKKWDSGSGFAESVLRRFQNRVRDPEVIVPSNVDQAEVYFQNTKTRRNRDLPTSEQVLNLWGEVPVLNRAENPVRYCELRNPSIGHSEVHAWYMDHVISQLFTSSGFVCEGDGHETEF